ncbi:MAG TPA: CoA ester lyase [Reyranella sp.]|nr:CoA ester lyase [Reyranella sp.]
MTSATRAELHRSSLMVPMSDMRYARRAATCEADSITLDLEDGVADAQKIKARELLAEGVGVAARGGARIEVRVNRPMGLLVRDIEAAVLPGVSGLRLPKVESAGEVRRVSEYVGELERERKLAPGSIQLQAMIETPLGLQFAHEIACADPRVTSIGLGGIDFAAACGFAPTSENLTAPSQTLLFAARAAGIRARGLVGSFADFSDLEAFRSLARYSRRMGFCEGGAIHPAQVPILNEEMGPSDDEMLQAREITSLAELNDADGRGVFAYRGRMIDKPIVLAAQHTLALAEAVGRQRQRQASLRTEAAAMPAARNAGIRNDE